MTQQRRISTSVRPRRPGSGSGPRARRRAVVASEPARGDALDYAGHNADVLLAQAEGLDSAVHLEWVVSRFLPCWGDAATRFDREHLEPTVLAVVDELDLAGDDVALTVLRGLGALARDTIAEASTAAAERLEAAGVTTPAWAAQIGQAKAVAARVSHNAEDDSAGVMIEYAYPDGARHALAAFIADDMGGAVKFMGLTKPFGEAFDGSELPFQTIDPAEGKRMIREALEVTDQERARFEGDPSMRELGPLAWSRVRE